MFQLGAKSKAELQGVHRDLVRVVERAIQITTQDFGTHDGLRTAAEQAEYVRTGASTTTNSRHLTGHAVDNVPYLNGKLRWEWALIYPVAFAMAQAAKELGVPLRWGGVWDKQMSEYDCSSPEALKREVEAYCVRHPGPDFLDGPHFELPRKEYP